MSKVRSVLAAAFVLAVAEGSAAAQVDARLVSLSGQVVDQTGAVLPQASIIRSYQ